MKSNRSGALMLCARVLPYLDCLLLHSTFCGQITTADAPFLTGSAQQRLTTNDHVIDGAVHQHSSAESQIFPRYLQACVAYACTNHPIDS